VEKEPADVHTVLNDGGAAPHGDDLRVDLHRAQVDQPELLEVPEVASQLLQCLAPRP
jgi:hypothetical protein